MGKAYYDVLESCTCANPEAIKQNYYTKSTNGTDIITNYD